MKKTINSHSSILVRKGGGSVGARRLGVLRWGVIASIALIGFGKKGGQHPESDQRPGRHHSSTPEEGGGYRCPGTRLGGGWNQARAAGKTFSHPLFVVCKLPNTCVVKQCAALCMMRRAQKGDTQAADKASSLIIHFRRHRGNGNINYNITVSVSVSQESKNLALKKKGKIIDTFQPLKKLV